MPAGYATSSPISAPVNATRPSKGLDHATQETLNSGYIPAGQTGVHARGFQRPPGCPGARHRRYAHPGLGAHHPLCHGERCQGDPRFAPGAARRQARPQIQSGARGRTARGALGTRCDDGRGLRRPRGEGSGGPDAGGRCAAAGKPPVLRRRGAERSELCPEAGALGGRVCQRCLRHGPPCPCLNRGHHQVRLHRRGGLADAGGTGTPRHAAHGPGTALYRHPGRGEGLRQTRPDPAPSARGSIKC